MGAPRRASTALLATTVILGLGRLDTASGEFAGRKKAIIVHIEESSKQMPQEFL